VQRDAGPRRLQRNQHRRRPGRGLELLHRLRFGEPKDGDTKFDNANALRLLTQHRETVARQRAIRSNEDVAQVRASLRAKLMELREQVLAQRKAEQKSADALHG
jgi:hypothetical protein